MKKVIGRKILKRQTSELVEARYHSITNAIEVS